MLLQQLEILSFLRTYELVEHLNRHPQLHSFAIIDNISLNTVLSQESL
jgi:hypothetical protein